MTQIGVMVRGSVSYTRILLHRFWQLLQACPFTCDDPAKLSAVGTCATLLRHVQGKSCGGMDNWLVARSRVRVRLETSSTHKSVYTQIMTYKSVYTDEPQPVCDNLVILLTDSKTPRDLCLIKAAGGFQGSVCSWPLRPSLYQVVEKMAWPIVLSQQ